MSDISKLCDRICRRVGWSRGDCVLCCNPIVENHWGFLTRPDGRVVLSESKQDLITEKYTQTADSRSEIVEDLNEVVKDAYAAALREREDQCCKTGSLDG